MIGIITLNLKNLWFAWNVSLYDKQDDSVLSNEVIIEKIKEGNKQLYELLLERYSDKMFRYLYYYFNFSKPIAEEVVQEIFVQVWRKLDKFDTSKKFESWLYRLAHNFCIDWLRKNSNDENASFNLKQIKCLNQDSDYELKDQIEDVQEINQDINAYYKKKIINKLLENLEMKYKEVIILNYFENKSYDEIGEILDLPKNSVGTLLSRGKKRLKEIIASDKTLFDALEFDL